MICVTRYLEVFEIFQGKIWIILKENWTVFYITQIYPEVVTMVIPIMEMDTGQTLCITTIWAQGSDVRWKIAWNLNKWIVEQYDAHYYQLVDCLRWWGGGLYEVATLNNPTNNNPNLQKRKKFSLKWYIFLNRRGC